MKFYMALWNVTDETEAVYCLFPVMRDPTDDMPFSRIGCLPSRNKFQWKNRRCARVFFH